MKRTLVSCEKCTSCPVHSNFSRRRNFSYYGMLLVFCDDSAQCDELEVTENTVIWLFGLGCFWQLLLVFFVLIPEKQLESLNSYKVSPSSPNSLDGPDLSSIDAMMSAVMNVGKIAENGGNSQSVKSPTKSPAPNRIGRRNQVCARRVKGRQAATWEGIRHNCISLIVLPFQWEFLASTIA